MHLTLPSILLATSLCMHSVIAAPVASPDIDVSKRAPLMISNPFGINEDGGLGGGDSGAGSGWITDPPDLTPTDPGNAYQACYTIYSSPKIKRSLSLSTTDIEKRCRKLKSKREALMISNPFGINEDGGLGGGDGGAGVDGGSWPGDVGDGFLQCYSVYYSQKRGVDEGGEGLEKRCGKEKRALEGEILKRGKGKLGD